MSHCQVTLSANAGVAIHLGSMRLWSDAVHDRRVVGFSTVTPERWTVLQAHPDFASPDVIFFTHCHPDHYSRAMTEQAVARYPMWPWSFRSRSSTGSWCSWAPAAT